MPWSIASVMTSLVYNLNQEFGNVTEFYRHYRIQSANEKEYADLQEMSREEGANFMRMSRS